MSNMKNIKINGLTRRVFVLKEADERIVYIPIKYLHRVDYDQLIEIQKEAPPGMMLEALKKVKLKNGRNALLQLDSVIHVAIFTDETKTNAIPLRKDGVIVETKKKKRVDVEVSALGIPTSQPATVVPAETEKKPYTGKPRGRKKKVVVDTQE